MYTVFNIHNVYVIQKAVQLYGGPHNYTVTTTTTENPNQISYDTFNMFESVPRYGNKYNLLFQVS